MCESFPHSRNKSLGFERHRIHLPQARQLRTHKPACAGTNVALHTLHSRVQRILVSAEFRCHHRVTRLPAKRRCVDVRHAFLRRVCKNQNVQPAGHRDEQQPIAHDRKLQVDRRIFARQFSSGLQFPSTPQDSQRVSRRPRTKMPGRIRKSRMPTSGGTALAA